MSVLEMETLQYWVLSSASWRAHRAGALDDDLLAEIIDEAEVLAMHTDSPKLHFFLERAIARGRVRTQARASGGAV